MSTKPFLKQKQKVNQTSNSEFATTVISKDNNNTTVVFDEEFDRFSQRNGGANPEKKKAIDEFYRKQMMGQYSLLTNPAIHPAIRYGMFITLIVTTVLFIWSNLSIGAAVNNFAQLGGLTTRDNSLGELTFLHSIGEMWNAGVYVLAGLIAFGSGAWPYIKLIMLMGCLTLQERQLSFKHRETILVILDAAGKWALVDGYVMFILGVGFRYNVQLPIPGINVEENVVVVPQWGFYSFLLACLLSLIITHIMIYQHRQLRKRPIDPNYKTNSLLSESRIRASGTIILYFVTFGFCIYGVICHSFYFEFQGLGALLYPPGEQKTYYSIIKIIMDLRGASENSDSFGAIYQSFLFFTLSIVLSFGFLVLLGILLFVPMKLTMQRKLSQLVEIIYAWATLDVMTLTIVVTAAETEKFSEFNLGDTCDGVNQLIRALNDSILPINIQPPICFLVVSGVTEGMVYLGIASVLFLIQGAVIIRLLKIKLDKKIKQYFDEEPLYQGRIDYTNYMIMKSKQNSILRLSQVYQREKSFQLEDHAKYQQKQSN